MAGTGSIENLGDPSERAKIHKSKQMTGRPGRPRGVDIHGVKKPAQDVEILEQHKPVPSEEKKTKLEYGPSDAA
jgi:hypothetical protein